MHDPMGIPHDLIEHDPVEHWLAMAAKAMAISGGIVFLALIGMSLVSIVGRKLGFGPVTGDIELMQAGTAAAAVSFLPYCTLLNEHIKVDFFTDWLPDTIKGPIDGIADILIALVSAVLTWRTYLSVLDLYEYGEVTPLVSFPLWIPTAALIPGLVLMAVCALYRGYVAFHPTKQLPETKR